jgi:hypothetical protein
MSTPRKPPGSIDRTVDVSCETLERAVAERDPAEDGGPPLSPHAPKDARPQPSIVPDIIEPDIVMSAGAEPVPSFGAPEGRRLPRAGSLPPVPGLPPVDSGERFTDSLRSPFSLVPERVVPPPMTSPRRSLRGPLRILAAGVVAAPIAYYCSIGGLPAGDLPAGGLVPPPGSDPALQMEAYVQRIVGPPWMSVGQPGLWPTMAQDDDPETLAPGELSSEQTETSQTATISGSATMAMSEPAATGAESPPSSKAVRTLDPEELEFLTRRGEQFALAGDLVTARALFQRAADAGNATAAMALGATYDPDVLAKLGVVGVGADVEKARSWYQKAESQGSAQATRRLQALANR